MNEPIQKYFRLGTLQWMSYPNEEPLEALKKIASDDFFDAIETKGYGTENAQAAALLAQSHLTVCYGAHPHQLSSGLNPNAVDETAQLAAQAALLENLEEAASIGATGFAFLSGKWTEETKELAYAQLLKTTRALCSRASELGIFVEMEVFDYDVDKCALIGPAPLAARFADQPEFRPAGRPLPHSHHTRNVGRCCPHAASLYHAFPLRQRRCTPRVRRIR